MTDPVAIDYETALLGAVITRLKGGYLGGATVWQHVPDKTPIGNGMVIVTDLNSSDAGVKGDVRDEWTMMIRTITRGTQKAPLLALQARVRGRLDRWMPAPTSDVAFRKLRQVDAGSGLLPEDEIYFGTQTFQTATSAA